MPFTPEQLLGQKLANTLSRELEVPKNTRLLKEEILDDVPSRFDFFNHRQDHKKIEPTKEALLKEMVDDKKAAIAFCCASLKTGLRLSLDIDHVFPRARIVEKQKLLLKFLNQASNKAIAQAFLGEKPPNAKIKSAIGAYFKRDLTDKNKIKGTRWFFAVCYNSLNNLIHLKHYLNRDKSSQSPQEWFDKYFPPKLNEKIKEQGGINEGVIMQQIFSQGAGSIKLDKIKLGKDKSGKEVIIFLHEGKGLGLGKFIRRWFKENASAIIVESQGVGRINDIMTEMLSEKLADSGKGGGLKKFIEAIDKLLQFSKKRSSIGDETSQDTESAALARNQLFYQEVTEVFDFMHELKRLKQQVLKNTSPEDKDEVKSDFYQYCLKHLFELPKKSRKEAYSYIEQGCKEKKKGNLTAAEFKNIVVFAEKKANPEHRAKAAEARANAEAKARKKAEAERDMEKKAREEAEAKLAEYREAGKKNKAGSAPTGEPVAKVARKHRPRP